MKFEDGSFVVTLLVSYPLENEQALLVALTFAAAASVALRLQVMYI